MFLMEGSALEFNYQLKFPNSSHNDVAIEPANTGPKPCVIETYIYLFKKCIHLKMHCVTLKFGKIMLLLPGMDPRSTTKEIACVVARMIDR